MTHRSAALTVALSLGHVFAVAAQEPFELAVRAGAAWNSAERYGTGAVMAVRATQFPGAATLGFGLEALAVAARHAYTGILPGEDPQTTDPHPVDLGYEVTPAVFVAAVLRQRPSDRPYRFYAYGGPAVSRLPWETEALGVQDIGAGAGVALGADALDHTWVVDLMGLLSGRRQGGVLFAMLTVGIEF